MKDSYALIFTNEFVVAGMRTNPDSGDRPGSQQAKRAMVIADADCEPVVASAEAAEME